MTKKSQIKDFDYEIQFLERLLEKKPDFVQAMEVLADTYTKRGFIDKGLALDEKLAKINPKDPVVLYNLACSYSLLNEIEKSIHTIERAIECGYDDLGFIQWDPDLSNLRSDQRFSDFLKTKIVEKKTSRTK